MNPLVLALNHDDRRVQLAAAAALVGMNPFQKFPGSSQVVPTLARFVTLRTPRALVIDGNPLRANSVGSILQKIGYDPTVVPSGVEGFGEAASSADFEIILLDPTQLQGAYNATDTLVNLRADSRTAGIPVFVYGPLANRERLGTLLHDYKRVGFLVTPTDPALTKRQIDKSLSQLGVKSLTTAERSAFAQQAAASLASIGTQPNSPFAPDLARIQPSLSQAISGTAATPGASAALGDIPGVDAQRSLAEAFLDPSRSPTLRYEAGTALTRSIQKFGPLLTSEEEAKLASGFAAEPDPAIRSLVASIVGALRPSPAVVGQRLQAFRPATPPPAVAPPAAPAPAAEPKPDSPPPADAKPAPEPKPDGEEKP
jgi:CheY-like chemotaxis protein